MGLSVPVLLAFIVVRAEPVVPTTNPPIAGCRSSSFQLTMTNVLLPDGSEESTAAQRCSEQLGLAVPRALRLRELELGDLYITSEVPLPKEFDLFLNALHEKVGPPLSLTISAAIAGYVLYNLLQPSSGHSTAPPSGSRHKVQ